MKKITIVDDNGSYDIKIKIAEFPDELDVTVLINGKEYSGTLTKD